MTAQAKIPKVIEICEVGPRDGLQSEERIWSVAERVDLIDKLTAAGIKRIETASFVNPKRVPQMADGEAIMAQIKRPPGVAFIGLALNGRGVERAIASGVHEIRYVVMASETFNQRNQGTTTDETLATLEGFAGQVMDAGINLSCVIGTAFGCPFEGKVPLNQVVKIAKRLADIGVQEIGIGDTIGAAVPTQVTERVSAVRDAVGKDIRLGGHFHNTRNTGFANAVAALGEDISFLDSSIGGLGGCPFAPAATGNIATEDLCLMLRNMGYETGIDLNALIHVARWVEPFFGRPLPGQVMKAGLFPEVAEGRS